MVKRIAGVEELIREMFAEDCYRYCTKEICIRDIAKRANVSVNYVRKVVKGF